MNLLKLLFSQHIMYLLREKKIVFRYFKSLKCAISIHKIIPSTTLRDDNGDPFRFYNLWKFAPVCLFVCFFKIQKHLHNMKCLIMRIPTNFHIIINHLSQKHSFFEAHKTSYPWRINAFSSRNIVAMTRMNLQMQVLPVSKQY